MSTARTPSVETSAASAAIGRDSLFRRECVEARISEGHRGDVVRVSPGWIQWAYWTLLALSLLALTYLAVGKVDRYSSGTAIIRVHDRTEVAAQSRGPLASVEVAAGQRVEPGAILARLDDTELRAELQRVRRDLDAQLRRRMLDPADTAAAQALIDLRSAERGVRDRLALRELRAPHAGIVSDLRIRPGQHIEVGDVVLSLLRDDDKRRVVALLPGGDRPQLHPGMPLRLELHGYPYAYQRLVIDTVSNEVIGESEVRRYLGSRVGDSLDVPGPIVVVEATLSDAAFVADGERWTYHDGMQGIAEVRIRSESLLEVFFPPLKRIDADD